MSPIIIGKAASNLGSAKFASRTTLQTGSIGEKKTARALTKWAGDRDDLVLAHSLRTPSSSGDTDHVVAKGHRIILVDSKKWKSGYTYALTPKFEVRRSYGMGTPKGRAFKAGKVHMVPQMDKWKKALGEGYAVAGIVVIAAEVRVIYDDNWKKSPFKLTTLKDLPRVLDAFLSGPAEPIDPALVSFLNTRLIK